ncbi:hypothetical protein [Rhizobium sp. AG855]|uniref:hypothetical protein n=1 Tax=Rhizobium sp. AG855 TaxID=2183898 RepID=UPI000E72329E|nr:hypothetical protein [Rhizobium sp. AG855]RKE76938.1 hypothetical protein DFO46_4685 [Rhizobium sp. AG855]
MQISDRYTMRIPAQQSAAKDTTASPALMQDQSPKSRTALIGPVASSSHQSLGATLSASALNTAGGSLSRTPTTAGMASPALAAALSSGVVNPADWLSPSDISLYEQTIGGTIKDGVIYDKDGNINSDQGNADLVNALFDMRNFGTFAMGQPKLIAGDITSDDLKAFIDYHRGNSAVNTQILDKALEVLTARV